MFTRKTPLSLIFAGAALVAADTAIAALPGALDTSFGGDGLVMTNFDPYNASAEAVIQQPDGMLVVAGYVDKTDPATNEKNLVVVRYNGFNGARDLTFGSAGVKEVSYGSGIRGAALARQSNDKLLVAGWVRTGALTADELALVRLNANGSLDTSFSGDGVATAAVGTANARAFAVMPRSDGTVWVAGYTSSSGSDAEDFMLVRFKSNGALDDSFGSGGGLMTDIGNGTDKAYAIARQSDGKVLLVGEASVGVGAVRSRDFAVVRYTSDGKLDGSFSSDGKQVTSFSTGDDAVARAVIQQKDGKIVVVGSSAPASGDRDIAVARYLQNGSPDPAFSGDGQTLTDIVGNDDIATGVIQQYDGKLLVSGSSLNGDSFLVRYNTNGTLDTGFGIGGKRVTSLPNTLVLNSMVQQADGQVVVAGYTYAAGKAVVAVLRHLFDDDDGDGVVDTVDNCQYVANPDQTNSDPDALGDACDDDDDNDGVLDVDDAFPLDPTESVDTDGDGIGNNADTDDDNDGVLDGDDPFPLDPFLLGRTSGDSKGDTAGYSVAMVGDVNGDGFADILVGAPKNDVILPGKTKASTDVGSAYLVSGETLGGVQTTLHVFDGAAKGDEFGGAVAAVGDVDNDAIPDFAVAAPKADQIDPVTGKVLVKDRGAVTVYSGADYSVLFTLNGEAAGDGFGVAVTAAGDIDADSHGDIVVGAWKADTIDPVTLKPLADAGAAYLYSGQTAINSSQAAALLHKFQGEAKGDYFGYSVAAGSDLDHDAVDDIAVGAYKHNPLSSITGKPLADAGSVYTYSSASPYTLVKRLDGAAKGDNLGFALAAINNGMDAFADLLAGSPGTDVVTDKKRNDAGQVSLFSNTTGTPAYTIHAASPQAGARFGSALARAGDVNGAGAEEFVVGAPKTDVTTLAGVKLKDAGQISAHSADTGAVVFTYDGRYKAGQAGFAVAGGGDQNNDGDDDVLIGSPFAAWDGKAKAGVAEVISGKEASAAMTP